MKREPCKAGLKLGVPAELYESPADHAEVWAAVRSLPKRQQQVLALHYLEGYSINEVAALLGVAEGTVKTHLHQGRNTLRDTFVEGRSGGWLTGGTAVVLLRSSGPRSGSAPLQRSPWP